MEQTSVACGQCSTTSPRRLHCTTVPLPTVPLYHCATLLTSTCRRCSQAVPVWRLCTVPLCATLCHTVPHCVTLCHSVPLCATLCHSCAFLCHTVSLCHCTDLNHLQAMRHSLPLRRRISDRSLRTLHCTTVPLRHLRH